MPRRPRSERLVHGAGGLEPRQAVRARRLFVAHKAAAGPARPAVYVQQRGVAGVQQGVQRWLTEGAQSWAGEAPNVGPCVAVTRACAVPVAPLPITQPSTTTTRTTTTTRCRSRRWTRGVRNSTVRSRTSEWSESRRPAACRGTSCRSHRYEQHAQLVHASLCACLPCIVCGAVPGRAWRLAWSIVWSGACTDN